MNNLQLVLQESQTPNHAARDPRQYILRHTTLAVVKLVQTAGVHKLHAVVNATFDEEGTVKLDYLRRDCSVQDVKLHDDRIQLAVIEL